MIEFDDYVNEPSDMDMIISGMNKKTTHKRKKYILSILPSFFEEEIEKCDELKASRANFYDLAKGYLGEARRSFAFAEKARILKEKKSAVSWLNNALCMLRDADLARNEARKVSKIIKRRYANG